VSPARAEQAVADRADPALRTAAPGRLWPWVKWVSWVELAIFALLLVFWLAPGAESETFIFGLSHGIGYIVLCLLIWVAILRHEAPYTLLAATLTPVGPLGSVIGIEVIERKRRGDPESGDGADPEGRDGANRVAAG
jgi:hypothetical protein